MKRLAMAAGLVLAAAAAPASADPLAMDQPISLNGIETVCTGIGDEAMHDPRWAAYPIRVEFSNGGAQYLAGPHFVLKDADGKVLTSFDCDGPWVLLQLPAGKDYIAAASFSDDPQDGERTGRFTVPGNGKQKRVVLAFPHIPPNH